MEESADYAECFVPKDRELGIAGGFQQAGPEVHAAVAELEHKQGEPDDGAADTRSLWIYGVTG